MPPVMKRKTKDKDPGPAKDTGPGSSLHSSTSVGTNTSDPDTSKTGVKRNQAVLNSFFVKPAPEKNAASEQAPSSSTRGSGSKAQHDPHPIQPPSVPANPPFPPLSSRPLEDQPKTKVSDNEKDESDSSLLGPPSTSAHCPSTPPVTKSRQAMALQRTPTDLSKRGHVDSLGLSPEQSVFWLRTPPMEALKKLNRSHNERSHEDDIASIVGRLYPDSSMARARADKPKDLIRDMINSHRGRAVLPLETEMNLDEEVEGPTSDWAPTSPTASLLNRLKSPTNKSPGFSRHKSVQDVASEPRRRDPLGRRTLSGLGGRSAGHTQSSPSKKSREDTLRMIEQLKASFRCSPSQSQSQTAESTFRKRVALDESAPDLVKTSSPRKILRLAPERPVAEDMISRTPPRPSRKHEQPDSPNDYDDVFGDFKVDEEDLDELIQMETQSASMSASSNTANLSEPASSSSSYLDKSFTGIRPHPSELGTQVRRLDVKDSKGDSALEQRTKAPGSAQDEFDDLGDFDNFGDLEGIIDDDDLDDFGGLEDLRGLDDDFEQSESTDQKTPAVCRAQSEKYLRYTVLEVNDVHTRGRYTGLQKIILGRMQGSEQPTSIHLDGSWATTKVEAGDIVHVVNARLGAEGTNNIWIDDFQGFLIVKPDYLVPTSALSQSFTCIRRPIIELRAKRTDESSAAMIHGTIIHELFQESLRANDFSEEAMKERVEDLLAGHLKDLCLVNESIDTARDIMLEQIAGCREWARRYLRPTPSIEGTIDEPIGQGKKSDVTLLCVNKILDIEENIWSPMFGLKGKIDATIQVTVQTREETRTLTVPFELKTGKKSNVIDHRAQTMLYTLLMTDRYDVDVQWGLLFYLRTGEFIRVPAPHQEIRVIIMQRNEVAFYEGKSTVMPPMVKSEQKCKWCFSFSSCTVLHKLLEEGTTESAGIGKMFDEATDHLNPVHAEFLSKWNRLLSLEQGDVTKFQSQIWAMQGKDRQGAGDCLGGLQLVPESEGAKDQQPDVSLSSRFGNHYSFKLGTPLPSMTQQSLSQTLRNGSSLLSSNISVGDPIVLSSDSNHYALAIGQVLSLTMNQITVALDKALVGPPLRQPGYDYLSNQSYRGLIEISEGGSSESSNERLAQYHERLDKDNIRFRIDKDEMSAGISRTRNNLVQLFRSDTHGGDAKRRELIVDLRRPVFESMESATQESAHLNQDQMRTIKKVLAARDYTLILGMPGTGKTTTIAELIHTLVSRGKSVLLTSYTHTAVDNVLLKLHPDINTIRLGNKDKVHRDIQSLVPDFTQAPLNTPEAIHNFYGRCQVVGTTCLGIGDPLFAEKRFDYCIVDEASQITLPACLGPIRFADVFVLVGDHNQLPPLVKNAEARKSGYDQSLFKILSDHYPEAVTSLTHQYRMNKDVMLLSNTLVYQNQLQCANEEVANKILEIPDIDGFRRRCHGIDASSLSSSSAKDPIPCAGGASCWLETTLDARRSVVFIDTDRIPAVEVRVGQSTQNPTEALLVCQITEALISGGIAESDIGIISVLRAQLRVLSRLLASRPSLDIHTVDRYQGKDKDCVIVSLVRSNAEQHVGELLKDWRRINVAFTRAKKKLIVIGSRKTLQGSEVFEQFLRLMERQDWVLRLGLAAHHLHPLLARPGLSLQQTTVDVKVEEGEEEEEDKENIKVRVKKEEEAAAAVKQEPKVARASAESILKRMPTVKAILNSM